MNRRSMLKQLSMLAALAATGTGVLAQTDPRFETLPNKLAPEEAGTIEVLEFFHYGCPFCRNFEPLMHSWAKNLPEDVVLRRVPAIWENPQLRELARLYYTLESLDLVETLHEKVFVAVQEQRLPLHTEDGVRRWLADQDAGVDAERFFATYKSFGLQAMLQRADQHARAFRIRGVPALAIGGQYITSGSTAGSLEGALVVADELIVRARSELSR